MVGDLKCYINRTDDIYCYKKFYDCVEERSLWIQVLILSTVSVSCCAINVLLIRAAMASKSNSDSVKIFKVNLSISYIIVGIYIIPMWSISTFFTEPVFHKYHCFLNPYIAMIAFTSSQWFLSAIAIDRCLTLLYPLHYPILVTNTKIAICVVVLWVTPFLASLPPFFGWGKYCFQPRTMPVCGISWTDDSSYTIFMSFFGFTGPLAVIFYSYMKISLIARKLAQNTQHNHVISDIRIRDQAVISRNSAQTEVRDTAKSQLTNISKELKLLKIVLLSVGVLVVCWTPYVITNIWHTFHKQATLDYTLEFSVTLITYLNCLTNPLLFIILNKTYRNHVVRMFRINNRIESIHNTEG